MKASDKALVYEMLVAADCLYSGKTKDQYQVINFTDAPKQEAVTLESVALKIASCNHCALCKTRNNTVPGTGVKAPLVLVIGEAPGADEDLRAEPFVGKAGQLLDKMLCAIQLSRASNCFITNVVKCRPPANRDPLPEEADACSSFLSAQIALLKPKAILSLGRIATMRLLKTPISMSKTHGNFFDYNGIPFMPTYHPSALLRDETLKRPAWEDLKKFRTMLLSIQENYQQTFLGGDA